MTDRRQSQRDGAFAQVGLELRSFVLGALLGAGIGSGLWAVLVVWWGP